VANLKSAQKAKQRRRLESEMAKMAAAKSAALKNRETQHVKTKAAKMKAVSGGALAWRRWRKCGSNGISMKEI